MYELVCIAESPRRQNIKEVEAQEMTREETSNTYAVYSILKMRQMRIAQDVLYSFAYWCASTYKTSYFLNPYQIVIPIV